MRNITLFTLPGNGQRSITVPYGTRLSNFVAEYGLEGRVIQLNGTTIAPADFANTVLDNASEIYATSAVKGNA